MSETVGLLGLGQLGLPMARNLQESGYSLAVYNRTACKAASLVQQGARLASSPADAVPKDGIVVSILWDTAAVEEVVNQPGFLDQLGNGIHVSMCTGSPDAARRLAELHAAHGSTYIEAPVFGRPEAAAAKKLWICCAGPKAAKERVWPVLTALGAQGIYDFGEEIGAATMVKLAGNFLLISAARSLLEAVVLIQKSGHDPIPAVDMLTQTLFNSPIYQNYGRTVASGVRNFPQQEIPLKDLGLFATVAQEVNAPAPLAKLLRDMIQQTVT